MALWVRNRPAEKCNPGELVVAECLSRLNDDWIVCWGFRYGPEGGTGTEREGDFLVQGPSGHVCVLEVKSGRLRQFVLTGYWEHASGDNPAEQLFDELQGVLRRFREVCGERHTLVHHALAVPNVSLVANDRLQGQLARPHLADKADLLNFPQWWQRHVASRYLAVSAVQAREMFLKTFAPQATPKSLRVFVRETDKLLFRHIESESTLLDVLRENRQILVEGGCGCGKTFLALEQAVRWAEADGGQRVLFLCYNLPLAEQLRQLTLRKPPTRGEIVVRSWEALASDCLATAGIALSPPEEFEARRTYYTVEVPGLLLELLDDGLLKPQFDALVVDEGQDHDTSLPSALNRPELAGWWSFYLTLLKHGSQSHSAVFFDREQRPRFRGTDGFQLATLAKIFSQPAFVTLDQALRYTRPVFQFLTGLKKADGTLYAAKLRPPSEFREGPEVEVVDAAQSETATAAGEIARRWVEQGLCDPHDILLIGRHRDPARAGFETGGLVGGFPLTVLPLDSEVPPKTIPYVNVHRAKGLDRLAVILVDTPPWAELSAQGDLAGMEAYFAGASRARQLLAVIHRQEA